MRTKQNLSVRQLTLTALITALLCILGPLSVPIGPVPISLTNFVLYLTLYLCGTKSCLLSLIVYLLLGTAGLPVFSGFSGGPAKLAGPTGGYLIGFIFMTAVSGCFITKSHGKSSCSILGMAAGTLIAYALGTVWFLFVTDSSMLSALTLCVVPFLPGDAIKILLASQIGPRIRHALTRANLTEEL